jgi:hypothetical protein
LHSHGAQAFHLNMHARSGTTPLVLLSAKLVAYLVPKTNSFSTSTNIKIPDKELCMKKLLIGSALVLAASFLYACSPVETGEATTDIEETAQQVGDVMASVDESGGSSGAYGWNQFKTEEKMFAHAVPRAFRKTFADYLLPDAQATLCIASSTYSSCTNNVITHDFNGCTIGTATLTGTVTLTWTDAANDNTCAITANGHSITREPNFTLTGRRGATLTVTHPATGQVITRTAPGVFSFANDGIRRVISYNGNTLFDFTTSTPSGALTITGLNRNGRVLTSSGGAVLRVTNNLSGVMCDYTPSNVTWQNTCTCAKSGTWSANCSDGRASTLSLTGCGTATFTMGTEVQDVTFDRCAGS